MIVEDEKDIRGFLELALTQRHFEVTIAEDGVDALVQLLRAVRELQPYRIVVLDAAMPFADGFSVIRVIRCLESNHVIQQRTKIGLYTGYPELLEPSTLLEKTDIDGFAAKPDNNKLFEMITELVDE